MASRISKPELASIKLESGRLVPYLSLVCPWCDADPLEASVDERLAAVHCRNGHTWALAS